MDLTDVSLCSHLHGHKPMIVGRAQDYTSDDPALNPPLVEGQANPMRRDTVQIPSMNSATLRVVADNPGVWFLHCESLFSITSPHPCRRTLINLISPPRRERPGHIEWHLEVGLAIQLVEAPLIMQQRNTVPQALYDQCQDLGLPISGNAAGHADVSDLAGLPLGPYPQVLGWKPKGIWAMTGCVFVSVRSTVTSWFRGLCILCWRIDACSPLFWG